MGVTGVTGVDVRGGVLPVAGSPAAGVEGLGVDGADVAVPVVRPGCSGTRHVFGDGVGVTVATSTSEVPVGDGDAVGDPVEEPVGTAHGDAVEVVVLEGGEDLLDLLHDRRVHRVSSSWRWRYFSRALAPSLSPASAAAWAWTISRWARSVGDRRRR